MKNLSLVMVITCIFCFCSSPIRCADDAQNNKPFPSEKLKIVMQDGKIANGTFIGENDDRVFLESKDKKALIIKKADIMAAHDDDSGKEIFFAVASNPSANATKSVTLKKTPVAGEKLKIILLNEKKITGTLIGEKTDGIFLELKNKKSKILKKQDIASVYDADTGEELRNFSLSVNVVSTVIFTSTPVITPTMEKTPENTPAATSTPTNVPAKAAPKPTSTKTATREPVSAAPAWSPQFHFGIEGGAANLDMSDCNSWLNDTLIAWNEVAGITGSIKPITSGFYCALNLDYCFLSWLALCGRFEYIRSMQDEGRTPSPMSSIIVSLYPATIGICLEPRIANLTLKAGYFFGYSYADINFLNGNITALGSSKVSEFIAGFSVGPVGLNFGYRFCIVPKVTYQGVPVVDPLTGYTVSFDYSGAFGGLVLTF